MGRHSFAMVLVGPRALLREGLARILSAADFSIAATAASVDDLTATQFTEDQAILLVLDVSNDQSATIRQIKLFREQHPVARIALLANDDQLSDGNIVAAFRSGANAYFLKPSCDTFIKSLELVMLGETILPPAILSFILHHDDEAALVNEVEMSVETRNTAEVLPEAASRYGPGLSAREQCILRCLIEGESNKSIARKNDIAEATVKVHVKAILRKIRVNNRTQAAIWAMSHDSITGGMRNGSAPATTMAADPSFYRSAVPARPEVQRNGVALSHESTRQLASAHGAIRIKNLLSSA
ncbi:two-component system, NarL family, nitrate/nitrite response regulator NarL [Rhizobiales bacterium GAS191]|nr:two-component system, NarL family, nitrate/nitrite response regulator NarL [Rhizobiales bacterium GAS191]